MIASWARYGLSWTRQPLPRRGPRAEGIDGDVLLGEVGAGVMEQWFEGGAVVGARLSGMQADHQVVADGTALGQEKVVEALQAIS